MLSICFTLAKSRGVYPYLPMAKNAPWSILGGINKKLLKHVFALYSLPIIFSKKFCRYARSIAFYPQLTNASMQCVLPTPFIYFFNFFVSLSLTASFQISLKTCIKLHKIAHKISTKLLAPWWFGG